MKIQFIINPYAGSGKGQRLFPVLLEKTKEFQLKAECTFSRHPQESAAIAKLALKRGCQLIVACGGDGTIHSLIPELINHPAALGVIPIGTANDLARNWKIPFDLPHALETLIKGQPRAVDLIQSDSGDYIAGAGGVGFDVAVVQRALRLKKRWKGLVPFILATLVELCQYKPPEVLITAEAPKYQGPAWQVVFTKIPRYALFLKIDASVERDDGWMEVCIVPNISRLRLLSWVPLLPLLALNKIPRVLSFQTSAVTVQAHAPLKFHGDGEVIGQTPAHFRVLPKALRVMMPAP